MQCEVPDVHIDMFHLFIVSSSLLTVYCSFLKHTSKQKQYIISNFGPGIIRHAYLCIRCITHDRCKVLKE